MANSYILGNNLIVTGSITASGGFYGDGSGITNITATNEWDGTRNGNASITGSLVVSGSGATVDFTNVTSNLGTTNIVGSLSNGLNTFATGEYSHAEGYYTNAQGDYSHAEGEYTQASGDYSHAEGFATIASEQFSHAEGYITEASGFASHAEGFATIASGSQSHAEGTTTIAFGDFSHAEGDYTIASGQGSHAEGYETIASGSNSHAEGYFTKAIGNNSHAEGQYTTAKGDSSHAEGFYTIASGSYSHAEGDNTVSLGIGSHAEGSYAEAKGNYSHAEGDSAIALGEYSHAEGASTTARGDYSHTQGTATVAFGDSSHAEGSGTVTYGEYSHAEGSGTIASGSYSHTEGTNTLALGNGSHAEGAFTVALGDYQHVQGQYNISSSVLSAFIHGNGTSNISRSNLIYAHDSIVEITGSLSVEGSANITGPLTVTRGITGSLFGTASYALGGARAIPAGDDKQIQFNNAGTTEGTLGLTYDIVTHTVNQGVDNIVDSIYANYSHAEGKRTTVKAAVSHTEGLSTITHGDYSHAEGLFTATGTDKAYYVTQVQAGKVFFDEVYGNITNRYNTGNYIQISAPGSGTNVIGTVLGRQYIAGIGTVVTSSLSTDLAPFGPTIVSVNISTSPSNWIGDAPLGATGANTQGESTVTTGGSSHAEGYSTLAAGDWSHAEGWDTKALGNSSHVEGVATITLGDYSHAEGYSTLASGFASHAEGTGTVAQGSFSHAEGYYTLASGSYSHAEGFNTISAGDCQHVQGQYNIASPVQGAFIIGNGTPDNNSNLIFTSGSQVQITGSLLVTGSVNVVGGITGSLLGTASFADLAYAIPGGTTTEMQYNNAGALGGTTGLTWDSTTSILEGRFSGDGSRLTGLVSPTAQFATTASHAIQANNATTATGYNHTQSTAATTWVIVHGLGNQFPIVQVYSADNVVIVPEEIQGFDTNTTIVRFSFTTAGYARIL